LLDVTAEQIVLTLLPRTAGRFTRQGLRVNKLRYYCDGYTEQYLAGGEVIVAYNPDDVSVIWLIEDGKYIRFDLIDNRFAGKSFDVVEELKERQRKIGKDAKEGQLQAEIDLARSIENIANHSQQTENVSIKGIRENRRIEQQKKHIDYVRRVGAENGLE
jgi:putative transposase